MAKTMNMSAFGLDLDSRDWLQAMARAGYASKGAIYLLIGVLAFMAAFGLGGSVTGPREALETLQPKSFGKIMLALVAAGLCCYSVWRFVQAYYDADAHGTDAKGKGIRTAFAVSGLVHLSLAWAAAKLALGRSGGSSLASSEEGLTSRLMQQPFGVWLVGLVGVIIAGIAVYHVYRAVGARFRKRLDLSPLQAKTRQTLCRICQFGILARGVTFGIIAWFFIRAAVTYNPMESGGLPEALGAIAAQSYGPWLLGIMGAGLAAYGIYALVEARYRRINV